MPTHVALLRGINVGRVNRMSMADLRQIAAHLGHTEVATYLQSGNVVFTPATDRTPSALAEELSTAVEDRLGVSCRVVALTTAQWRAVVTANPYVAQAAVDPKTVHAAVQQDEVSRAQREILEQLLAELVADGGQDHLTVVGRTTYLCTPDGLGRSRLADRLTRRKGAQDDATARNWRTVEAIASLLEG